MKFLVEIVHIIILINMVSHGVHGHKTKLRSQDKDEGLEEELNSLNKPPIWSFMKDGDIIDCINIYNQRAFDHPLLKNHKLQLRPSSLPKPTRRLSKKKTRITDEVELCPNGTVPFKRVEKDDLLRAKEALLNQRHPTPRTPNAAPPVGVHYAAISTPVDDVFLQFFGAKTRLSVYNLTVDAQQISEAFLWIGAGVDSRFNSIEYGWTINPALYGDHQPRTYSLWTDAQHKTGCYNSLCSGYVHVNRKRIMGGVTHPVSNPGKTVFAIAFSIFKDTKTDNWWLVQDFTDGKNEPMGYWPNELLPRMKSGANVVQLGGKVYSPPPNLDKSTPPMVPMGSGAFVPNDFSRTSYASNIEFVNSNNLFYPPDTVKMLVATDLPNTYKAYYRNHPQRGYTLLFGGPN